MAKTKTVSDGVVRLTKKNAEAHREILEAWLAGKEIQYRPKGERGWDDFSPVSKDDSEAPYMDLWHCEFRIKPEIVYRPWTKEEAMRQEVVPKDNADITGMILSCAHSFCWVQIGKTVLELSYQSLVKDFITPLGVPAGVEVEGEPPKWKTDR